MGDINDNATLSSSVPITGMIGPPDAYSRSAATLTVGGQALQLAIYVSGAGAGFAANADPGASAPRLAGIVNPQTNAGMLNNGNLDAPILLSIWGESRARGLDVRHLSWHRLRLQRGGRNVQSAARPGRRRCGRSLNQTIGGATYSIAANGRGTASYMAGGKAHSVVLYLDDFNDGYILDTGFNVGFGFFEAQSAGPFTDASMQGGAFNAGTWFSPVASSPNTVGQLTFSNALAVSGAATGTYAVDASGSGRGTAALSAAIFGSNNVVFYIGGPNFVIVMGSDAVANDAIAFMNL